jgi:hypothetical protein
MKKRSTLRPVGLLLIALAAMAAATAYATGPLMVGGPGAVPGVPYRWTINPLTYWTDLGLLGLQTNTDADTIVTQSFQVWQDVPTANLSFSVAGKLGADVDENNILDVLGSIEGCGALGGIAKERSIIYDVDGSAVAAVVGLANQNTVLGFASAACLGSNGVDNYYQRGYAVLNGRFLDGIDTFSNPEVPATEFKAVMIHEFGHLLGLDHSQINLACLTGGPGCDLQGLPTMFPILVDAAAMSTLATDDVAGLSELYPETVDNPPTQVPYASTTGRITGRILFSDGATPAQGFNVIARRTDNPLVIAVSMVSGFLFTSCEGNPVTPPPYNDCGSSITPFGSRNTDLIGFYYLPGLPPGNYTVGVEAINNTGDYPFVGGSGLGPIGDLGFQFPLPSLLPTPPPCTPEYLVSGATATCSSAAATVIPVAAGSAVSTGTDVILIGTPPRYDAWEDGP